MGQRGRDGCGGYTGTEAPVGGICIHGRVEDCAGQRKNTVGGRANIPRSGNKDASRTSESLGSDDLTLCSLVLAPGTEARDYHRHIEDLYLSRWQIHRGADGVQGPEWRHRTQMRQV